MARKVHANDGSKDVNYDFTHKGDKKFSSMGSNAFANMPDRPMYGKFDFRSASYRDGIMNNPATGVEMISDIDENGCR